jgi:tetratricopeptide (TPR) repeat protein
MAGQAQAIEDLLKKADRARGGPAAEALRKAAQLRRDGGDVLGAVELYERAAAQAAEGPAEPRLRAAIDLEMGALFETELGRIDRAMETYARAFKTDPDNVAAIEAGRRIYRSLGDWQMVARLYEVEVETAASRDKRGELLVQLGKILSEKLGDRVQAAVRLEEAVRLRPHDEVAKEALAALYISPDFPVAPGDDSSAQLARAAHLFLELADARAQKKDVDGQIAFLRRSLGADPYHVEAATRLERAYQQTRRTDELRRFYRQGAAVPRRALKLAELHLEAGELDAAIAAVAQASDEGDDASLIIERLEEQLAQDKKWGQIAELRERYIAELQGRDRADLLVDVAGHWQRAGNLERFESSLLEALALDPIHPDAYPLLAEHLAQKRDYQTLVGIAEQAVEASSLTEQPERLGQLAELYEKKLGDVGAAADAWRRAEALMPSPRGATELKRLSAKQERWQSMIAALEKELAAAHGDARAEVMKRLGQVHRERHDLAKAWELWQDALDIKPNDATIYRALAELAEREGKIDVVAETLRRQLKAAREKVEKLNLLRRLAQLYDERLKDLDGTEWACLEILEQLPGDRDALRRLEAAYERAGESTEQRLIEVLESHAQAAATPAERGPLLHRLAALYEKHDAVAEAAERLERAIKVDKNDVKAQEGLARLYVQLGKWPEAAMVLERNAQRAPAGAEGLEAWKKFARVVDGKLGDAGRSLRAWREVLERRPTDKEALEALSRLGRARNDWQLLDEVLARRQQHTDGDEAVAVALERAELADERLKNPARAIEILRHVIAEMAPRELEAHARLRKLLTQAGDRDGAMRIAERELFLADDAERKLAIAVDIARRWKPSPSPKAAAAIPTSGSDKNAARHAITAWRRVVELAPTHEEGLTQLAALYQETGDFPALAAINERRLALAEAAGANAQAVAILFELAMTAEERLGDAKRAFSYFRRAHELARASGLDAEGLMAELRRVAERHQLWEELCAVYATLPGLDARLAVAEVADERLRDPRRAFTVVRGALDLDPSGARLLPELERLSARANDPQGLLDVYEQLIARAPIAGKLDLLRRRAKVREERQKDPSGALDELLRAFPYAPEDKQLLAEVRRLAEITRRWNDELAVEGYRFHLATDAEKLAIACEAAALVEEKVKDNLRAFRAYLRAFQLAPVKSEAQETIRGHLWRLARLVGEITVEPPAPPPLRLPVPAAPPPTPRAALVAGGGVVVASNRPARDPTLEVPLDEVIFEETGPHRKDPTVELSINDLMTIARPQRPPTVELSISDVAVVARNGAPAQKVTTPAPPPMPLPPQPVLTGAHSAWEELALVQLGLPAADAAGQLEHLLAVSEMWEKGAGNLDRAFAALGGAFTLDPDNHDVRAALERLAEAHEAWDPLVAILDDTLAETGNAERAVRLINDSARVRQRQGQGSDAEARYHRALGMRPDDEEALTRLEALYRQSGRDKELANLLERRLHGLIERMPPGEPRRLRAIELAETYERLGNSYEAIDAWGHVAREYPDHVATFAALARLYEGVGQWSKVIESLTRELDLYDGDGRAGAAQARAIRRRIGQIFERELELPERAIEAYSLVHDADAHDVEAAEALERLFEKLSRWNELETLLSHKSDHGDPAARLGLLERRAQLLAERLNDPGGAATVLKQLRRLKPDDDEVAARLERALGKAGRVDEQADVLRGRIRSARSAGASKAVLARMHVELGLVETQLGDTEGAERTLQKALELQPDDPRALAELAHLRQSDADWDGYAAAREREAEVAESGAAAATALVDAARVHLERRKDDAAAKKALERALAKDPTSLEAIALLGSLSRRMLDDNTADRLAHAELALTGAQAPMPSRRAELYAGLGAAALRRSERQEAARWFREALAAQPSYPPAIQGLADLAAQSGAWDEVEALLRDAAARDGVPPQVAAQFHRRLADAAEKQGRLDDAYAALLEADRILPGDLTTRLSLGENRYRAHRYREAAQYLGAIGEHPDAERKPEEAAEAVYHGALAELKLRRPDRALPLLESAVRIHPGHVAALGLLAERSLEAGDLQRGLELLELQAGATREPAERAVRFERVADALLAELNDTGRAGTAYDQAVAAAGEAASTALLDKALNLQRAGGRLEAAAATAQRLLERERGPEERARRLREAAALDAALGNATPAREKLQAALELAPLEHETLAGLSALLVQEGNDQEAAQLLTRALPLLPPPPTSLRAARAALWLRLGECRERLRDHKGALTAFEKALEADPTRRPLREILLARYGDEPAHDVEVRAHRMRILDEEPLHAPSLRALWRTEARAGARDGGRRFLELLAVAGDITEDERRELLRLAPAEPKLDPNGTLDEDDHQLLAHPDALPLAAVFSAVWEGTAADLGRRAPSLESAGVGPGDRISPVEDSLLARAYSLCARMLGNRKTGLYRKPDGAFAGVVLIPQPPTAIVTGDQLVDGRPPGDVRFILGRALEIARPEYILAAALSRHDFTRLFAAILRAFHPRHARRRPTQSSEPDEASMWKRALPYKVAKRLAELFKALSDTEFSSAKWRKAVQRTGARAGLLTSGDIIAAARVLRAENDHEGVVDLARFAASDDYVALRAKLDGVLAKS